MAKAKPFTLDDLKRSAVAGINSHHFTPITPGVKSVKRSKYGNKKLEVDGKTFDSVKEANRYKELLLLLKAGCIGLLELQVPYELNEGGTYSLKYIADFVYWDIATGLKVVEDVKGYRTREYLKKKRLMFKIHKIKINEK